MANKIESVITEKEIESLKKEIQVLEQEIMKCDFLTDNNKKKYCNIILKIHTKEELYKIQKEIDDIRSEVENQKKTLSKRESNLLEKEDKIDYWSSEKVLVEKEVCNFQKRLLEKIEKVKNVQKEVAKDIEVIETVEVVKKRQGILLELLLLLYITKSELDPAIKIPLSLSILNEIDEKLHLEDENVIHIEYHYEDVSKKIENVMDEIEDIEKEMQDALFDVRYLQKEFEKDFQEYKHLPEFLFFLEMFITIEETLTKEMGIIDNLEKDLDRSKEENDDKILYLSKN